MRRASLVAIALLASTMARGARAEDPHVTATRTAGPDALARRNAFTTIEPYFTSGFGYFASDRRLIAGVGGGLGARLNLGPHLTTYLEARRLWYTGAAWTGAVGGAFRYRYLGWEPQIGLHFAAFHGDQIEVIASTDDKDTPTFGWAVQGRLVLLRFVDVLEEHFTVSALAFDWGYGSDARSLATAFNIGLIDIGFRL